MKLTSKYRKDIRSVGQWPLRPKAFSCMSSLDPIKKSRHPVGEAGLSSSWLRAAEGGMQAPCQRRYPAAALELRKKIRRCRKPDEELRRGVSSAVSRPPP